MKALRFCGSKHLRIEDVAAPTNKQSTEVFL
jgi:hypothetical protein